MQDRISTYPGRVTLTPVPGQEHTYDMTRADQPTQPGTPLNKATFLKDATAALYGLGADAVPDEVLAKAAPKVLGRGYGTCSTAAGTAAKTAALSGFSLSTGAVVGIKFTYGNTAANPTLNVNRTGAKPIYNCKTGTNIKPGDIDAGMTAFFMYNGSQWVLLSPVQCEEVVCGSYVGTGKSSTSGKNSLTFDKPLKSLVIQSCENTTGVAYSVNIAFGDLQNPPDKYTAIKWYMDSTWNTISGIEMSDDGKTISWYGSSAKAQANESGYTYRYEAVLSMEG